MKKVLLFMMAVIATVAAQAWTVNFTNPENWSTVKCYCYGGSAGEALGAWSGTTMTKNGDVWTISSTSGNPSHVIFNNGSGSQTGNLVFEDGATYDKNGVVGAKLNDYTIYFVNEEGWTGDMYAYTWMPELFGGWPGKKMTSLGNNKYSITIQATTEPECSGFKFHNNSGSDTSDLTGFKIGETYTNKNKGGVYTEGGDTPGPVDPTPENYSGWYVNIGCDNWKGATGEAYWNGVAVSADGKVSWENLPIGDAEFAVKVWDDTNKKDLFYYADNIEVGTATALTFSATQVASTIAGAAAGDSFDVAYDCATNTITITKVGGENPGPVDPVEPGDYKDWYVNIGCDNWKGETGEAYWNGVAVSEDGKVNWESLPIGDAEFAVKVWDATNKKDLYYYAENIVVGTPTVLTYSASQVASTIAGAAAGESFDVAYDCATNTITITKVGGETPGPVDPVEPGDYNGWYVNIGCDNWKGETGDAYWNGVAVSEDGKVNWESLPIGDAEFAVKVWDATNEKDLFYYAENIVVGTPTVLTYSATQVASTIAGAAAGESFDVAYDCATNTITITKVGGETPGPVDPVEPGEYDGWYVNIGSDNWKTNDEDYYKGIAVPESGVVTFSNLHLGDAEFSVKVWDETNKKDLFFYAVNIPADVETVLSSADSWAASTIAGADAKNLYDVTYNVASNTIKVVKTGTVGVEAVEAAEEAVYFTLQGVKVANPENGLYIKVVNGKATKVLVK